MLNRYLKRVPTMIVIGVAGHAAWPTLFPERAVPPSKAATRPPSKDQGAPSVVGDSDRDPFQVAGKPPALPTTTTTAKASASTSASATKAEKRAALPAGEDQVLDGMRLGGTFVGGGRQIVIIDDKVYARGEALRKADGSPLPYVVSEVRKDRVVLRRGRKDFVLTFSDARRNPPAKATDPGLARTGASAKATPSPRPDPAARADARSSGREGTAPTDRPGGGDGNPGSMLLKLLSGLGGATSSVPAGANPAPTGPGINAATIQAGLDALGGKLDDIGRAGDVPGAAGGTRP